MFFICSCETYRGGVQSAVGLFVGKRFGKQKSCCLCVFMGWDLASGQPWADSQDAHGWKVETQFPFPSEIDKDTNLADFF